MFSLTLYAICLSVFAQISVSLADCDYGACGATCCSFYEAYPELTIIIIIMTVIIGIFVFLCNYIKKREHSHDASLNQENQAPQIVTERRTNQENQRYNVNAYDIVARNIDRQISMPPSYQQAMALDNSK